VTSKVPETNQRESVDEEWTMYGYDVQRTGNAEAQTPPDGSTKEEWRFEATGEIQAPAVVGGGNVFVGTTSGRLYALDGSSGQCQWQQSLEGWIQTSPVVGSEYLFVGCGDSRIYAFDRQTGKQQWQTDTKTGITTSPLRLTDLLIGANRGGQVFAINVQTGDIQWDYETTSGISVPIAAKSGKIVAVSDNGKAYILDAHSGRELETKDVTEGAPMLDDSGDIQFIGATGVRNSGRSRTDQYCAVKRRTGFQSRGGTVGTINGGSYGWQVQIGDHSTKPIVFEDTLLVSGSGTLYAFNLETGLPEWRVNLDDGRLTSPVVASGWTYLGSESGTVFGLASDSKSAQDDNRYSVDHIENLRTSPSRC